MSSAKKLLGYLLFYLLPGIISGAFTIWVTTVPNLFSYIYKCTPSNLLCSYIVYSIVFIVGYVVLAFIIGIIWDILVRAFPRLSVSKNGNLGGVNSLWAVVKERKSWRKLLIEKLNTVNLRYKVRKEGYEIFLDVKNMNWFVDVLKLNIMFNSHSFDWIQGCNKNGEVFIGKCKTKTVHFATIKQLQRTYDMHFIDGDLNNPFENDKGIPIRVEGLTSYGVKKYLKKDINQSVLLIESVSKGILNFEIGTSFAIGVVGHGEN